MPEAPDIGRPGVAPALILKLLGPLSLLFMITALATGFFSYTSSINARLVASKGASVEAVLQDKRIRSGGTDSSDSYLVEFATPEPDGVELGATNVSRDFFDSVEIGDIVPVTYVPNRPGLIDVGDGALQDRARLLRVVTAVAVVAAVAWILYGIVRFMSALRAARSGEIREARLTSRTSAGSSRSGKRKRIYRYRFNWTDTTGSDGTTLSWKETRVSGFRPGSRITVFVDAKTGRGWWRGDLTQAPENEVPAG